MLPLSVRRPPVLTAETSGPALPTNKSQQLSGHQRKLHNVLKTKLLAAFCIAVPIAMY